MPSPPSAERIVFIDTARFLAMALVFYGHFTERVMYLKSPTAAAQYKFIYSFHMVLFILQAGPRPRGRCCGIWFDTDGDRPIQIPIDPLSSGV